MARQIMSYAPYAGTLATGIFNRPKSGTGVSYPRSYTRTMITTKKRKTKGVSFNKMVMSTLPSKQLTIDSSATLTHNTLNTINLTQSIFQGTDNITRIGDSVNLCALKMKGVYFTAATAGAYTFRFLVGFSGEEYNASTFGGALGISQVFLPNTAGTFSTNGIVNPRAFTVLADQTIDVGSQIAGVVDLSSLQTTVPLNDQKFMYQSAASIYGKTKNLYVVVLATVGGGTTGTTAAGSCIISFDLIFK